MKMAREMEIELQRTREAIQKHAEEMIGLLLELETRLEERLMQAQARIDELKNSKLSLQPDPPDTSSDDIDHSFPDPTPIESGGALLAMSNHRGANSKNGSNHLNAS